MPVLWVSLIYIAFKFKSLTVSDAKTFTGMILDISVFFNLISMVKGSSCFLVAPAGCCLRCQTLPNCPYLGELRVGLGWRGVS